MVEPQYVTCACGACSGLIEFPIEHAGSSVECPHCGEETVLVVRSAIAEPPIRRTEVAPGSSASKRSGWRGARPAQPRSVTVFWWLVSASAVVLAVVAGVNYWADPEQELNLWDGLVHIVCLVGLLALYFLPSFIAARRKHRNETGVMVLNFLLGWTFLGWVAALVWAVLEQERGDKRQS